MVPQSTVSSLDEFIIATNTISSKAKEVAHFPTPIAEVARLNDVLYVVLSVPDENSDHEFAGTNLWAIDFDGRVHWKAPNLNSGVLYEAGWRGSYSDLRMFDEAAPKLLCYVDERRRAVLDAQTGAQVMGQPVNWGLDHDSAWSEYSDRIDRRESSVFLESIRLRQVSSQNPFIPRCRFPASLIMAGGR